MMLGAHFFRWLQSLKFYIDIHRKAAGSLAVEKGRWFDIGCGPGVLTQIANELNFQVTGFDSSADMILIAKKTYSDLQFVHLSLSKLIASSQQAQIVSASSLVFVLPEPLNGLNQLWALVAPGGHLLLIETTSRMSVKNALHWMKNKRKIEPGLFLWGLARSGHSVEQKIESWLAGIPHQNAQRVEHLDGLVKSWIIKK